jgi:hypothetical protein
MPSFYFLVSFFLKDVNNNFTALKPAVVLIFPYNSLPFAAAVSKLIISPIYSCVYKFNKAAN